MRALGRARIAAGFAAVGFAGVAACSLVTDLSGLTGGSGVASDGGRSDAGGDGPSGGGHGSAAEGGDGATGTFFERAGAHDLCADFDRSPDVTQGFDRLLVRGGTFVLDTTTPKTPPRSALAFMSGNGTDEGPIFEKVIEKTASSLHCEFDVQRRVIGTGSGSFALVEVQLNGTDGSTFDLEVKQVDDSHYFYYVTVFADGGSTSLQDPNRTLVPPLNAWAHVTVDLDLKKGRIRSTLDNVVALDRSWPLMSELARAKVHVGLGVVTRNDKPWSMAFDDVLCDVTP